MTISVSGWEERIKLLVTKYGGYTGKTGQMFEVILGRRSREWCGRREGEAGPCHRGMRRTGS